MRALVLAITLLVSVVGSARAATNLMINGSFERPAVTAADLCDAGTVPWCFRGVIPNWIQSGSGVSLLHNNVLGGVNPPILVLASEGVQYLDMNRIGGELGAITQVVTVTTGQQYRLDLDASAWATNAIGASASYEIYDAVSNTVLANGSFTATVGGIWTTRTLIGTATSPSLGVRIQSVFSPEAAIGIDNVVLTAVPEPGTTALLLAGLSAIGMAVRSRRSRLVA